MCPIHKPTEGGWGLTEWDNNVPSTPFVLNRRVQVKKDEIISLQKKGEKPARSLGDINMSRMTMNSTAGQEIHAKQSVQDTWKEKFGIQHRQPKKKSPVRTIERRDSWDSADSADGVTKLSAIELMKQLQRDISDAAK